jgi:hypothetical protein
MQLFYQETKHDIDKANSAPISPESEIFPQNWASIAANNRSVRGTTRASHLMPAFQQNLTKDLRSISRSSPPRGRKKSNLSSTTLATRTTNQNMHHLGGETRDRSVTPERTIRSPAVWGSGVMWCHCVEGLEGGGSKSVQIKASPCRACPPALSLRESYGGCLFFQSSGFGGMGFCN